MIMKHVGASRGVHGLPAVFMFKVWGLWGSRYACPLLAMLSKAEVGQKWLVPLAHT